MNRPPPLPERGPPPPPLPPAGASRHPPVALAAGAATTVVAIVVGLLVMSRGGGRRIDTGEPVVALDLNVAPAATAPDTGAGRSAGSDPQPAVVEQPEPVSAAPPPAAEPMPEDGQPNTSTVNAAGSMEPGAADPARDPGVAEGPPTEPVVSWSIVEAVELPVWATGDLDAGRGADTGGVDLGACPEVIVSRLAWDVAVPDDAGSDDGPRLVIAAVGESPPRWELRWSDPGAGVGDAAGAAVVATITAADGRLRLEVPASAAAGGITVLARSVLLARVRGYGTSQAVRLVRPAPMRGLPVELLGKPASAPIPLPRPLRAVDLAGGGCRIELEVAGERHALDLPAGETPDVVSGDYSLLDLVDGSQLGLHVAFDPTRGVISAKPSMYGPRARRQWLDTFGDLTAGGDAVLNRVLGDWDKRVNRIIGISLQAAVMPREQERFNAFIREVFQLPGGYAPRGETVEMAMDRLFRAADGRSPISFDAWMGDCNRVIESMQRGASPDSLRDDWQRTFATPLRAWWVAYRAELEGDVRGLAELLRTTRDRTADLRVLRFVTQARDAAGKTYDVTLARFDESPPARDDPPAGVATGLD